MPGTSRRHYQGKFQLVVVLNGCTDDTLGVVRRVSTEYPSVSALEFPEAIGKGGALIEGLKLAPLADIIGYVDADGATPPHALHDLARRIDEADCVIGSRWLPGAVLHVEQSGRRQFASRVFHLIVQCLFRMNIRDTQCGAKVMRREAVEKVHSFLRIADMAFDINLLYSLHREGYRILEVPTEWTDMIGSKVTLFGTSLVMFLSVVRIWLIYSPRLYKCAAAAAAAGRLGLPETARPPAPARAASKPAQSLKSTKSQAQLLGFEFRPWNSKLGGVSSSKYRVRRATLDDLGHLTAMWQPMQFPVDDLAKRVTEFQVAESPDGKVLGAVGLQIAERQGLVHSEAFSDFALAEHLRPLLWDRVHAVATNHGLLRVWTREQAPFWNHCGLLQADAEALQKLPALWRGAVVPLADPETER